MSVSADIIEDLFWSGKGSLGIDNPLAASDPELADYCRKARIWADTLNTIRNEMEHNFWSVPQVQYKIERESVVMLEPEVLGKPVSEFVQFITDRMLCFVEEVCAHGLKGRMPVSVSITEIPLPRRRTERPERFVICTAGGGMPLWSIAYHESEFNDT